MINGTDYVKYIKNKSIPFYSHSNNKKDDSITFHSASYNKSNWNSIITDDWHYMMHNSNDLPDQGWKIHISANLEDAQEVLIKVSELLITTKVSFKFIPDFLTLELSYSKNADRIEAGKFITIYPKNDTEFCELLDPLKRITDQFKEGPYILNDRPWKQSNVYYRYGGFRAMTAIKDGRTIYVIRTPDGDFIEDKRVPYFSKPDFVNEPIYIQENNTYPNPETFAKLDSLNIKEALHFSNAGGVYVGKYKGHDVVIKEGRPFIGIDQKQCDGFTRIKAEYKTLMKLKYVAGVVDPIGYEKIWKHNYLIEEKIPGETLGEYMAVNFPFPNNSDVTLYKHNALQIIHKLVNLVKEIHQKGFAIVDFQPENIMIDTDKRHGTINVRLIDFESAGPLNNRYNPNLVTQDYTSFQSKTFKDADWYTLNRIARSIFLPVESTMFYSPELEKRQNKNIKFKFGKDVVDYLTQVQNLCAKHTTIYRQPAFYDGYVETPQESINSNNLAQNIAALEKGITQNINYDLKGLIYGDIKQYNDSLSWYAINYGTMGTIMALQRNNSNVLRTSAFRNWLNKVEERIDSITKQDSSFNVGLFDGLGGIALILYELGHKDMAEELIHRCNSTHNALNISMYSGLTGLGLVNLVLYLSTNKNNYMRVAKQIADTIISRYHSGEFDNQEEYEGRLGLIKGWAGPVIFLWKLGTLINDLHYRSEAIIILDKIVATGIINTEQGSALSDKSKGMVRILPYLDTGFAGLSLVLMDINLDAPNIIRKKYSNIWETIQKDVGSFCTYQCCLFSGTAGLAMYSNTVKLNFNKTNSFDIYLQALNNFMLSTNRKNMLVPGQFGVKCSMDYETGAAGVLIALLNIENQINWLPLLANNPLNIFNSKRTTQLKVIK